MRFQVKKYSFLQFTLENSKWNFNSSGWSTEPSSDSWNFVTDLWLRGDHFGDFGDIGSNTFQPFRVCCQSISLGEKIYNDTVNKLKQLRMREMKNCLQNLFLKLKQKYKELMTCQDALGWIQSHAWKKKVLYWFFPMWNIKCMQNALLIESTPFNLYLQGLHNLPILLLFLKKIFAKILQAVRNVSFGIWRGKKTLACDFQIWAQGS